MRLRNDWGKFLKRAYSVRVQIASALASTAIVILPAAFDAGWLNLKTFAALMLLANTATVLFQITKQKVFDDEASG